MSFHLRCHLDSTDNAMKHAAYGRGAMPQYQPTAVPMQMPFTPQVRMPSQASGAASGTVRLVAA